MPGPCIYRLHGQPLSSLTYVLVCTDVNFQVLGIKDTVSYSTIKGMQTCVAV